MGRDASSSSSSGSESDGDHRESRRSDAKKARREKDDSRSSSRKRSSSKSGKKERKKESKKKDSKRSKSSKGERKHSGSSKESKKKKSKHSDSHRKRKRSRSHSSSSDGSSSDASSSSSRSASPARASSSSSHSRSSVPLPSASSVTRCLDLISTLLTHGGGDRAQSLQEVQFMLFKLDAGSSVDVSGLDDQLVRHILNTLLREAGCKVRRDPATNETGWMVPVEPRNGKPAYKLLDVLAEAFNTKPVEAAPAAATVPIGPAGPPPAAIGPTLPPSAAAAAAAASSADSTATAAPRMLGPAMPSARDFELLASSTGEPDAQPDAPDDDAHNFGPKMPSQMTAQELQAFDRLRASREHLASVKQMESAAGMRRDGGREEWMTALPTGESGMPSTAALAALAASGDREAMRGRGFATKAVTKADQDMEWAMSPAEKARRDAEKIAVRQAEQAVYNSSRAINGDLSDLAGGRGRTSANASAAAAQAANDRMMARYKQQQASTSDSLMAAHARAAEEAAKTAKASSDGLFRWDREKEMGMRAVKGAAALKKEISSAFTLSDNFAPASS